MSRMKRLNLINNHLSSQFPPIPYDESLDNYRKKGEDVNKEILLRHFFRDSYERIMAYRNHMANDPVFNHNDEAEFSRERKRERIIQQIASIYFKANLSYESCKEEFLKKYELLYTLCDYDIGLATRLLIHLVLYINAIENLGTSKHIEHIKRAYHLLDYGCFGMTELGHGSNVAKLETTATYDHIKREFVINSPTATSAKWWIGGLGKTSNMSVIFARLIVEGVDKGINAFVIPIRDNQTHDCPPRVIIGDCGKKIGLDGIDNGFILFRNYRVPYDSLLDKFSSITEDGKFKSSIKNKEKRLGIMMVGLIGGRVAVVCAAEQHMKSALTAALRFSAVRKQFSSTETENSVLDYPLQQYKLIPHLASIFAIRSIVLWFNENMPIIQKKIDENPEGLEVSEFHAILSACKGVASWYANSCVIQCREATGGLSYSAYANLGRIMMNASVGVTWEGDNGVLIQQTGKFILKQIQRTFKGHIIDAPTLKCIQVDHEKVMQFKARFENSEQLENESILFEIIEFRLNYLLHQSMMRLQEVTGNSKDMFDAWNKSQVYYIQELAKAYGEYIMMREYAKFVRELEEKCEKTGKVIRKLFILFSVGIIERNLASFQDSAMNAHQAKVVRDSMVRLCEELAEVCIKVIDAIAPPDSIHGSVLGAADGQVYAKLIEQVEKADGVYDKPHWLPLLQKVKQVKKT
ncbi:unnamed protein product [Blepharisma stoltei]|uniref:Acyl-coenzyme A oxidase n=1 Tax=Blepharisma stoltei TaxID=1481888 RepID=A0AAU9IHI2_9CILI|nr:unnamed protein product [Blepharisma stoltei]